MFFLNSQHGWLLAHPIGGNPNGNLGMFATTDGGHAWHLVARDSPNCPFLFTSTTTGWMGSDGTASCNLMRTDDGGVTWTVQQFPCPCSVPYDMPVFLDQSNGVVRVQDQTNGYYSYGLFATSDGGKSWHKLPIPSDAYVYAVDYQDSADLWLFLAQPGWGGRGAPGPNDWLYHSSNKGASWTVVQRSTPIGYTAPMFRFALWFVDSSNGFVVQAVQPTGDYPQLLATHDGGHTWHVLNPQIS